MENLLIYYGYLNSFNSAVNGWDNELVAQEMKNYDLLVFGNGVADPAHPDYANTQIIIPRIKELNPSVKIFGYVTVNQAKATFQAKVEEWNALGIDGIFLDEAGYDYGTVETNGRDAFNERLAFVKSQDASTLCFVNAWNPDHVLNNVDDPSYPNATFNANDNNSLLSDDDYFLLESFPVNTDSFGGSNNIQPGADWIAKVQKVTGLTTNVKLIGSGIINDDNVNGQGLFNVLLSNAYLCELDGVGSSDTLYGAGTANSKFWNRFDIA